eukprot:1159571-Pelagomonas_calceolata.AAC.3
MADMYQKILTPLAIAFSKEEVSLGTGSTPFKMHSKVALPPGHDAFNVPLMCLLTWVEVLSTVISCHARVSLCMKFGEVGLSSLSAGAMFANIMIYLA